MAIRTVVTRGYGNGTFDGTIALVVTRGYALGVAVSIPDFVFMTDVSAAKASAASAAAVKATVTDAAAKAAVSDVERTTL